MDMDRIKKLTFAFQPIVNIHTGICIGYEALLRNYKEAGFETILEVFDTAYELKSLFRLDVLLREKAIESFVKIDNKKMPKLFYNIDNRILEMPDYTVGNTARILKKYHMDSGRICFELSEKHEFKSITLMKEMLDKYRKQLYRIAVDDFGTGYSGLELLYHSCADYIKIDRFFISEIDTDLKKRQFVSNIINLAHCMGVRIIAEGVETQNEYYVCKNIGCEYIQGYFVQKPQTDISKLADKYDFIEKIGKHDRRKEYGEKNIISEHISGIEPLHIEKGMKGVFHYFKSNKELNFFPVVDSSNEPLGIIREKDIKEYVYSPFGKEVLMHKNISDFIYKCTIADVNYKLENILEVFAGDENNEGVIVVENGKYLGFLTSKSLVRIINEKYVSDAKELNPLTKMKGNILITEYISRMIEEKETKHIIVYFDFDNFKPFNDTYGFRRGDRAILMFSEIMKSKLIGTDVFIGHIGGDDFFAGFKIDENDFPSVYKTIKKMLKKYSEDVSSLYDAEDRDRGYIEASDRFGVVREFPMLSVSAVMLVIKNKEENMSVESISNKTAELKKSAKNSSDKITVLFVE